MTIALGEHKTTKRTMVIVTMNLLDILGLLQGGMTHLKAETEHGFPDNLEIVIAGKEDREAIALMQDAGAFSADTHVIPQTPGRA